MQYTHKIYVCVLLLMSSLGCERPHPARAVAVDALDAWVYGDQAGLAKTHIMSTSHTSYCQGQSFANVLQAAKAQRSDDECARILKVKRSDVDTLADNARLLLQIKLAVCEEPALTCETYSRRILDTQIQSKDRPSGYAIRKVIGDGNGAVVYVDLELQGQTAHRVIKFTRIEDQWYINSGFLNE